MPDTNNPNEGKSALSGLNKSPQTGHTAAEAQAAKQGLPLSQSVKSQGNNLSNDRLEVIEGTSASLIPQPKGEDAKVEGPAELSMDQKIADELAAQRAADFGAGVGDSKGTLYSSHPIQNYRLGRFHFEKTLLRLDGKDDAEFRKLLDELPLPERQRVKEIDEKAAAAIVSARLESSATKQFDSSVGADALSRLNKLGPTVGTTKLENPEAEAFANTGQEDMNRPVESGSAAVQGGHGIAAPGSSDVKS